MARGMIQAAADSQWRARAQRQWLARRAQRRHRLRTVLVTAIVVALTGLLAGVSIPVGRHLATAWWLEALEGSVYWNVDETNWRQGGETRVSFRARGWGFWNSTFGDGELHFLRNLHRVVSVDLAECDKVTSDGLAKLRGLEFLTELYLARLDRFRYPMSGGRPVPLDETCLAPILGLPRLESLSLAGNLITDRGLAQIAQMVNLKNLDLSATEVSDAGLAVIEGMTNLKHVDLGATRVTTAALAKLQNARPDLEIDVTADPVVEQALGRGRGASR
jgi:Leucine Rich repeat